MPRFTHRTAVLVAVPLAALLAAPLGGCAGMKKKLVGTWRSDKEAVPGMPFDFASVTFAPDGTYTAQMLYDGQPAAASGPWEIHKKQLSVRNVETGGVQEYGLDFENRNTLMVDGGRYGFIELTRYQP